MSVNKYQMFLKTVECGSFSKAAEEMNFTQSAVSHAVQALENELGVTLLSRNRGGVVLTADGRLLLPRIEKLCAAHHELMRSAAEPFIRLEEGQDYEITAALDKMGIRPNIKYTVREDRTMLAMVSKGLGISLLPELMVRHSPYPVTACHAPERFYRSIGIGVKDKKAMSAATRRFVDYVRQWVAENGDK